MDINNVDCSRLGTISYLDTQNGEEAMNKTKSQQQIRGNSLCMKILTINESACGQLTSNYT